MVRPGLLAVLSPCVVGLTFRVIGAYTGQDLLGAKAVAGLLIFTTVAGMQHALGYSPLLCFFYLHQVGSVWGQKRWLSTTVAGTQGTCWLLQWPLLTAVGSARHQPRVRVAPRQA